MTTAEFMGIRSQYYKEILQEMPQVRYEEREMMLKFLDPKPGEKILEIGAGSGYYSEHIAQAVFPEALVATDPSQEQLMDLKSSSKHNIQIVVAGADTLPVGQYPLIPASFDAVWAHGCFHHVPNKTVSFQLLHSLLKPGGRVVISDVYAGSSLAKHFDLIVAKYCATGHEVAFLTEEFADSLCFLSSFEKPTFYEADIKLNFEKKEDIGTYIYKIHAMIKSTPEECLKNAEALLGIEYKNGFYRLNWPHVVLSTRK